MRALLSLVALAASAAAMAPAAHAALVINPSAPAGTFANPDVTCAGAGPCSFSDSGTFVTPAGYELVSLTITTVVVDGNPVTNIDFGTGLVKLNAVPFFMSPNGVVETGFLLDQGIVPLAINTLEVGGITGGDASYSGTLSFAPRSPGGSVPVIPEPATWLLMLLGFGAMGLTMRRNRAVRVRYDFTKTLPQLA